MAVTITWKINVEFHSDDSEKYIYAVEVQVKGTETVSSVDYESIDNFLVELDKPDTLIAYDTFNKQSTLVNAAKTKMGSTVVTDIENMIKGNISVQQKPLNSEVDRYGSTAKTSVPPD